MCGIFGYLDRRGESLPEPTLNSMSGVIHHRGPDSCGRYAWQGGCIGMQRLSIIDVKTGDQPFFSRDGQIAVVQNGEIYNYVELKQELLAQGYVFETKSDTEVLLRLYESEGLAMLSKLNGMFGIAIWDGRTGQLHIARDRMGVKPIYVYDDGVRLIFGSEIKSILVAGVPRKLSTEALHHYFSFLFVPPPLTMFEGIRHLPPGHVMTVDTLGSTMTQWFDLAEITPQPDKELDAWCHEFREILDDSVQIRMRADVPFGAFLSGGLDSSSVVYMMSRHSPHPIQTFSIGFDDPRFDESRFSHEVARMFGTRHTLEKVDPNMIDLWPQVVWHCDQPHSDVSYMPMYRLSELAVRSVKMVLTGDGGDELFGGYSRYQDFFSNPMVDSLSSQEFATQYHNAMALTTEVEKRSIYSSSLASATSGMDSKSITETIFAEVPQHDRINQALYLDCRLLLPGNNLIKPDRMPMAVSLEARDPFLDPRLVQFAFESSGKFKLAEGQTRYAYKKAVEPFLGTELTHRTKQMFTVPIGEWFKLELKDWVYDLLLGERHLSRGLFSKEALEKLLDDHMSERANHTRLIRSFIALELWHRSFIDTLCETAPTLDEVGVANPFLHR